MFIRKSRSSRYALRLPSLRVTPTNSLSNIEWDNELAQSRRKTTFRLSSKKVKYNSIVIAGGLTITILIVIAVVIPITINKSKSSTTRSTTTATNVTAATNILAPATNPITHTSYTTGTTITSTALEISTATTSTSISTTSDTAITTTGTSTSITWDSTITVTITSTSTSTSPNTTVITTRTSTSTTTDTTSVSTSTTSDATSVITSRTSDATTITTSTSTSTTSDTTTTTASTSTSTSPNTTVITTHTSTSTTTDTTSVSMSTTSDATSIFTSRTLDATTITTSTSTSTTSDTTTTTASTSISTTSDTTTTTASTSSSTTSDTTTSTTTASTTMVLPRWNITAITDAGDPSTTNATSNYLLSPKGIVFDLSDTLYVSDTDHHRIQQFLLSSSNATTIAGNSSGASGATADRFVFPNDVAVDSYSNVYVADTFNNRVQLWPLNATSGITVAGDGTSGNAMTQLSSPRGIAYDLNTNTFYVSDTSNHRVMRYTLNSTVGVLVAGGNGSGLNSTQLFNPSGLYFDYSTNSLFIANRGANNVVRWFIGASNWSLVAGNINGSSGNGLTALSSPWDVTLDPMKNVYVADTSNHRIQFFRAGEFNGTTIAGVTSQSGITSNKLNQPYSVTFDSQLNLYVADTMNERIQKFLHY